MIHFDAEKNIAEIEGTGLDVITDLSSAAISILRESGENGLGGAMIMYKLFSDPDSPIWKEAGIDLAEVKMRAERLRKKKKFPWNLFLGGRGFGYGTDKDA